MAGVLKVEACGSLRESRTATGIRGEATPTFAIRTPSGEAGGKWLLRLLDPYCWIPPDNPPVRGRESARLDTRRKDELQTWLEPSVTADDPWQDGIE